MTVTESEPAEMPKLQERVEPFIDTAVIEVPAERTPRSESDSRQSSEIVSQDLASVVIPETEPEKAEKAESMPEEPVVNAEDTENETQKAVNLASNPCSSRQQRFPHNILRRHKSSATGSFNCGGRPLA